MSEATETEAEAQTGEWWEEGEEDFVVALDVARKEFLRFAKAFDLREVRKIRGMSAEDRESFDERSSVFVEAVQRGRLVVDEDGQPVFTPTMSNNKKPIVFRVHDGKSILAMDKAKRDHTSAKQFHVLAAITTESFERFKHMKAPDLTVCQAVMVFQLVG